MNADDNNLFCLVGEAICRFQRLMFHIKDFRIEKTLGEIEGKFFVEEKDNSCIELLKKIAALKLDRFSLERKNILSNKESANINAYINIIKETVKTHEDLKVCLISLNNMRNAIVHAEYAILTDGIALNREHFTKSDREYFYIQQNHLLRFINSCNAALGLCSRINYEESAEDFSCLFNEIEALEKDIKVSCCTDCI